MSANIFTKTLSSAANIVQGENGANKLASSGSPRIDAFTLLLQDATAENISMSIKNIIGESTRLGVNRHNIITDLFLLAFHKRGTSKTDKDGNVISDGEGCKNLFYLYIIELYNTFPEPIIELAQTGIFALYGYWKDYLNIWKIINEIDMPVESKFIKYNPLITAFRSAILEQRSKDLKRVRNYINKDKKNLGISFVGKFCVRESSSMNNSCSWFNRKDDGKLYIESHISYMLRLIMFMRVEGNRIPFPNSKNIPFGAKKMWRNENALLNRTLEVPEVKFCSGHWGDLNIGRIPSVCLHRNTKAMLNEHRRIIPDVSNDTTGNRYPDNQDRIDCREHYIDHVTSGKHINASAVLPNQIAHVFISNNQVSTQNKLIAEAQWASLLDNVKARMDAEEAIATDAVIDTRRILCCCDTSGSMVGSNNSPNRPIDIAVSLTALCSQLAAEPYRDLMMTFSAEPTIINLKNADGKSMTLQERIQKIQSTEWGFNTNYMGLHTTLLKLCVDNKVPSAELPVLVVFTDGEFDNMVKIDKSNSFETMHDTVEKLWIAAGYSSTPVICYWNITDKYSYGVQVEADHKGVFFLQGSSPSNIKYVIYGETSSASQEVTKIDPMTIFRKAMDQPYFEPIRNILAKSNID
jgi:hypothetical protein